MGKSVSDGKSAIASAITAKGVSTKSDATFEEIASNISNIQIMSDDLVNQNYELYSTYVINETGSISSSDTYEKGNTYKCPCYGKVEITIGNHAMDKTVRIVRINGVNKFYTTDNGLNNLAYNVNKGDVLYTYVYGLNSGSNPKIYKHIVHFSGLKRK